MAEKGIRLIVGLGNPGPDYDNTRHNAGAWFVEDIARNEGVVLRPEKKLHGLFATLSLYQFPCRLLFPTTFMNHSGQALQAVAAYYKLSPSQILVAHDELDLPAGTVKLKKGGGHGGHNGLRDIVKHLGQSDFLRLRIGIGHPGTKDKVLNYVLGRPSVSDKRAIDDGMAQANTVLKALLCGDIQGAMQDLHSP